MNLMRSTRLCVVLTAVAAGLLLLSGCGAGQGPTPPPQRPLTGNSTTEASGSSRPAAPKASGPSRPAHVVVVIFENKAEQQVIGSGDAPYLTSLAASGAQFTDSHGVAHPSQPNYLALFSGSTQGVTDDSCPQRLGDRPNLAQQLERAGFSFAGYSEGMSKVGYTGCTDPAGTYARKHNPWVDFANVPATSNRPFTDFPTDLSRLPTVSFVVPSLCHDMHDCDVATGDRWARDHLAPYVSWARTHNSLLVVTFDEDDGTRTNRIPTFLVGPMVKAATLSQPINHYNLLRTIEGLYGLEPLGEARGAAALTGWAR
jgi:acid phosphatase